MSRSRKVFILIVIAGLAGAAIWFLSSRNSGERQETTSGPPGSAVAPKTPVEQLAALQRHWIGTAADAFTKRVAPLLSQYKNATSLHCRARHSTRFFGQSTKDAGAQKMGGSYEYWAMGNKYRISSQYENNTNIGMSYERAFDGTKLQILNRDTGVLSLVTGDADSDAYSIRNPMFMPFQFLRPQEPGFRVLKMTSLCATSENELKALQPEGVLGTTNQYFIPGGKMTWGALDGTRIAYHVTLDDKVPFLIKSIDQRDFLGNTIDHTEYDYTSFLVNGVTTYWPQKTTYDYYKNGADHPDEQVIVLDFVKVNDAIPEETFTIDYRSAKSIFDGDKKQFIYQENMSR